jgi:hypothetical protein
MQQEQIDFHSVIPAKAGIHLGSSENTWIPAFAGMTSRHPFASKIAPQLHAILREVRSSEF